MRLHRLTFRSIGPFAGQCDIDFDVLGASGLFLLEGPTGSGKSTVIDAVVFALFGRVAGSDTSDDRLPSDFGAPDAEPFVELIFATDSGVYRVRRSPRYERQKRRGSGTVKVNATATLMQLSSVEDPLGEPRASGVADVSEQIQSIVGLNRLQFVQTVVLPQGEFARFLQSDAETRRELLQRLFGTELFGRVQSTLEERRRAARERLRRFDQEVVRSVAVFNASASVGEERSSQLAELSATQGTDTEVAAIIQSALLTLTRSSEWSETEARRTSDDAELAQKGRDEAERVHRLIIRKRALLGEQADLLTTEDEDLARRARLAAATRYDQVAGTIEGMAESEQLLGHATEEVQKVSSQLESPDDPVRWPLRRDQVKEQLTRLADVLELERSIAQRRELLVASVADLDQSTAAAAQQRAKRQSIPARIDALSEREHELAVVVALEPDRRRRAAELSVRVAAATRVQLLEEQLQQSTARHHELVQTARNVIEQEVALRRRRIEGMAGELAAELVPGEACRVCGSVDHPRPASHEGSHVTAIDLAAAEDQRQAAEAAVSESAQVVAGIDSELSGARGEAGDAAQEMLNQELAAAKQSVTEAETARAQLQTVELQRLSAEHERKQLDTQLGELDSRRAQIELHVDAERQALAAALSAIAQAADVFSTVAERVTALTRSLTLLEDGIEALERQRHSRTDVDRRRAELDAVLEQVGFVDSKSAESSSLDPAEKEALQLAVSDRQGALAKLAGALGEVSTIDETQDPNVAAARLTWEQAAAADRAAHAASTSAGDQLAAAKTAAQSVSDALAARSAAIVDVAPVIRMADLVAAATSDNARAMTLSTYVLLERFRDVVAAANQRLSFMSDGRYQLDHVVDKEGQRRSGLGLQVLDLRTDKARDPKTLSGGETFYCSLALALGLADVVTAESGGIALETLFVDEGFGSLDPDTLDHVLDVLGKLSSGGRTVGVVSHVAELKERIAERIQVSRLPDGSSTLEIRV